MESPNTENNQPYMSDEQLIAFLLQCKKAGITYRDQFKGTWDECELQIRCVLPDSYKLKEDWQTKIFIPMQSKKSEIAQSYLNKMIFGKTVNFDLTGIEGDDTEMAQNIKILISTIMLNGGYTFENKFCLQESVDIGTGWIKMIVNAKGDINYAWRSAYEVLIDPKCGHKLDKARFIIDQYKKDIADIIQESKKKNPIYKKEAVGKFLEKAVEEAKALRGKGETGSGDLKQAFMVVKGIDGTNTIDMEIPAAYATGTLDEYWVEVPQKDGTYESRIIALLNDKFILRNDLNDWTFTPFQWMRIKPRKYECFGKGYIENTRGLQDLSNSCINIGFDSLKISSMDIIIMDDSKVKDPTTIKYKPLAVWKMKDINAVKIQRQQVSAISDILKGVTLIDQIDQDASGVTRQAQGAPDLGGSGTTGETLGEYKLKLQAIDQRFLDVGRFIEQDHVVPMVIKTFKAIKNDKIFTQAMVDRILGMKEVDDGVVVEGQFKKTGKKKISKLKLEDLRKLDELTMDFKAVGVTQFADRLETLSKLKEALAAAEASPTLAAMTKLDVLWKKMWQISDIPDYDEFLKSKEDIAAEQAAQQPPPQQGMPQRGLPAPMPQGQPQGAMV